MIVQPLSIYVEPIEIKAHSNNCESNWTGSFPLNRPCTCGVEHLTEFVPPVTE